MDNRKIQYGIGFLPLVVLSGAALIFIATQIYSISTGSKQVDFRTYYFAGKTYSEGKNPYLIEELQRVSGNVELRLPYVYPPYTLPLTSLVSSLDYKTGYFLFLALKIIAIIILLW